ncbi:NUDIX domain-containing protein [Mesomycoplasma lagogenitalium]|uniref:NUDIX domain-containing protein n=1 Tax=Mesomycoplasma lagogenitalium TaxID=171286 RepID=A0ABY8LU27_9BACT|nr:NUDIX domain-containing protein [Mesomycoplasma lagogenitalium]WGI36742.1 NUDIX domain-containing protein [Mesomycoplasma lagogenitalium]
MLEISCGAIVFKKFKRQIKVLIVKQFNKFWSFPKGHVENDETHIQTAIRELKEETNLENVIIMEQYQYETNYKLDNNNDKKVILFLAIEKEKNILKINDKDITKVKYLPVKRAMNMLKRKDLIEILRKSFNDLQFLIKDNKKEGI